MFQLPKWIHSIVVQEQIPLKALTCTIRQKLHLYHSFLSFTHTVLHTNILCHHRKKIVLLQTCMYDCSTSELSCPKEVSITLGNYFGLFGKFWLSIIIGTFCRNLLAIANTYITLHYVPFRIMYISSKNRQCYGCKIGIEYFR